MPEIIELQANCTIDLEDAMKVFGGKQQTADEPATNEEDNNNGSDLHRSEYPT